MKIVYDTTVRPPRITGKRSVSAPTTLADRIEKAPILERLSADASKKEYVEIISYHRCEAHA